MTTREGDPFWLALRALGRELVSRDMALYVPFRDEILPLAWTNLVERTRMAALDELAKCVAELEVKAWKRPGEEVATISLEDCERILELVSAARRLVDQDARLRPETP